jgi:hypothetical protein
MSDASVPATTAPAPGRILLKGGARITYAILNQSDEKDIRWLYALFGTPEEATSSFGNALAEIHLASRALTDALASLPAFDEGGANEEEGSSRTCSALITTTAAIISPDYRSPHVSLLDCSARATWPPTRPPRSSISFRNFADVRARGSIRSRRHDRLRRRLQRRPPRRDCADQVGPA